MLKALSDCFAVTHHKERAGKVTSPNDLGNGSGVDTGRHVDLLDDAHVPLQAQTVAVIEQERVIEIVHLILDTNHVSGEIYKRHDYYWKQLCQTEPFLKKKYRFTF